MHTARRLQNMILRLTYILHGHGHSVLCSCMCVRQLRLLFQAFLEYAISGVNTTERVVATSNALLGLITDIDTVLAADPNYLLGRWLAAAKAFGQSPADVRLVLPTFALFLLVHLPSLPPTVNVFSLPPPPLLCLHILPPHVYAFLF